MSLRRRREKTTNPDHDQVGTAHSRKAELRQGGCRCCSKMLSLRSARNEQGMSKLHSGCIPAESLRLQSCRIPHRIPHTTKLSYGIALHCFAPVLHEQNECKCINLANLAKGIAPNGKGKSNHLTWTSHISPWTVPSYHVHYESCKTNFQVM